MSASITHPSKTKIIFWTSTNIISQVSELLRAKLKTDRKKARLAMFQIKVSSLISKLSRSKKMIQYWKVFLWIKNKMAWLSQQLYLWKNRARLRDWQIVSLLINRMMKKKKRKMSQLLWKKLSPKRLFWNQKSKVYQLSRRNNRNFSLRQKLMNNNGILFQRKSKIWCSAKTKVNFWNKSWWTKVPINQKNQWWRDLWAHQRRKNKIWS